MFAWRKNNLYFCRNTTCFYYCNTFSTWCFYENIYYKTKYFTLFVIFSTLATALIKFIFLYCKSAAGGILDFPAICMIIAATAGEILRYLTTIRNPISIRPFLFVSKKESCIKYNLISQPQYSCNNP